MNTKYSSSGAIVAELERLGFRSESIKYIAKLSMGKKRIALEHESLQMWILETDLDRSKVPPVEHWQREYGFTKGGKPAKPGRPGMHFNVYTFLGGSKWITFRPTTVEEAVSVAKAIL